MKDYTPDKTKNKLGASIHDVITAYIHQANLQQRVCDASC